MENGREAASRGLAAARDGDTVTASAAFHEAALTFAQARDKLESPLLSGGLAVPLLAPNVRAARTLAEIGTDLANAGEAVTAAVDPDALSRSSTAGSRSRRSRPSRRSSARGRPRSRRANRNLNEVRDDPYLAPPVRDAVGKVHTQLARANREAQHAAAAAELAPAIFGGEGPRTYLLVVQNNAESRATGGFIGSYGLITAQDGKLARRRPAAYGHLERHAESRFRMSRSMHPTTTARVTRSSTLPRRSRTSICRPTSRAWPRCSMSLAPQAGLTKVDGVLSVDPEGLAALAPAHRTGRRPRLAHRDHGRQRGPGDVARRVRGVRGYTRARRLPRRRRPGRGRRGDVGQPRPARQDREGARQGCPRRPPHARVHATRGAEARRRARSVRADGSRAIGRGCGHDVERGGQQDRLLPPAQRRVLGAPRSEHPRHRSPPLGLARRHARQHRARRGAPPDRDRSIRPAVLRRREPLAGVDLLATADRLRRDRRQAGRRLARERARPQRLLALHADAGAEPAPPSPRSSRATWQCTTAGTTSTCATNRPCSPTGSACPSTYPTAGASTKAPGMDRPFAGRATATLLLDKTKTFRVHVVRDPGMWDLWTRLEAGV